MLFVEEVKMKHGMVSLVVSVLAFPLMAGNFAEDFEAHSNSQGVHVLHNCRPPPRYARVADGIGLNGS